MALKKSELYSSLWQSCDELRGGMDASQYKDYVLVLLLVKYISDKYAGQPFAPITIPEGASFKDMVALKGKSDIGSAETSNDTTVYDPTCGSGSLLLKVGEAAKAQVTLYGQEKDSATSGLARMNMILHDNPGADIRQGNALASPLFTDAAGQLKTFDSLEILHAKYLKAYISYQGVQRLETFLFPFAALREALLNAVVHKDYSSGIPIQISVYEHQIVIWNPGQLPQDWTLERLMGKHPSVPFNPLVADAFFRAGYIESWGRGIEKINRECRDHDIEAPVYDYGMSGLMLTFKANPQHLAVALGAAEAGRRGGDNVGINVGINVGDHFTAPQKEVLSLLETNAHLTSRELASRIGITQRHVERAIANLKKAGKLSRVGANKTGHWKILN